MLQERLRQYHINNQGFQSIRIKILRLVLLNRLTEWAPLRTDRKARKEVVLDSFDKRLKAVMFGLNLGDGDGAFEFRVEPVLFPVVVVFYAL